MHSCVFSVLLRVNYFCVSFLYNFLFSKTFLYFRVSLSVKNYLLYDLLLYVCVFSVSVLILIYKTLCWSLYMDYLLSLMLFLALRHILQLMLFLLVSPAVYVY